MTIRIERFQCLALAVVLGTGSLAVCMFLLSLAYGVVVECWRPAGTRSGELLIFRDGTPVIKSYDDSGCAEYRSLDGKLLSEPRSNEEGAWLPAGTTEDLPYDRTRWRSRVQKVVQPRGAPTIWYFVKDGQVDHRGYFEGYNQTTKLKIGCVGRNGARQDRVTEGEQFRLVSDQISYSKAYFGFSDHHPALGIKSPLFLATVDGIVAIGLDDGKVEVIRQDADLISCGMNQTGGREVLVLRTSNKVILSDLDGKEFAAYSLPVELRDIGWKWYGSYANAALLGCRLPNGADLFWIDEAGAILRREHVILRDDDSQPLRWFLHNLTTVGVSSPVLMAVVTLSNPWDYPNRPKGSMEYAAAVRQAFMEVWPGLLVITAFSVVLAVLCYRRQRRYGLPWTGVWTGFVLVFGLPGYLGYLAHRTWPARLPCPNCGQRVPRDRPACIVCGKDFPAPALKGIEVFG